MKEKMKSIKVSEANHAMLAKLGEALPYGASMNEVIMHLVEAAAKENTIAPAWVEIANTAWEPLFAKRRENWDAI